MIRCTELTYRSVLTILTTKGTKIDVNVSSMGVMIAMQKADALIYFRAGARLHGREATAQNAHGEPIYFRRSPGLIEWL